MSFISSVSQYMFDVDGGMNEEDAARSQLMEGRK
jgi:hypothetical protein